MKRLFHNLTGFSFRGRSCFLLFWTGTAALGPVIAQTKPSPVVLEVQGTAITADEFSRRLNFAPRLDAMLPDSDRRKAMAASVIAELMFARQAQKEHLDTLAAVVTAVKEAEKEAVYEEWMKREVADKVSFTGEELRKAYRRFIEQRRVDYAVFDDSVVARRVQARVHSGEPLASIKDMHGNPVSQTKTLSFGEALPNIEDIVYAMKPGDVSDVIRAERRFYVFQLRTVLSHPVYSKHDFAYWYESVVKRVRERKETERFSALMDDIMPSRKFTVRKNVYEYVLDEAAKRIPFGDNNIVRNPDAVNGEFVVVPDDVRDHFHEPMIHFDDGGQWTVGDFWGKLRFGPYLLNYQSREDLRNDFSHLIRSMVMFETIVQKGYESRLDTTATVRRETRMWRDDLLAKLFERTFTDTVQPGESDVRAYYDENRDQFRESDRRRIQEIVVGDRNIAVDLIERIRSGEDMKELVRKYSLRPSREEDARDGVIVGSHAADKVGHIAFSLPPGGLYGPIDIDSVHVAVIRLEEVIKGDYRPFGEVRAEASARLRGKRLERALEKELEGLERDFSVKIDKHALQSATVLKGTMMVRKSHFPNRNAVPVSIPIDAREPWFEGIWNMHVSAAGPAPGPSGH